jgi:hypothetical protein
LPQPISDAIHEHDLIACSVLSGNRNFEGRINPDTKANYLASPPLVVAYALTGRMDLDLTAEPLGQDEQGNDVYLSDIWPTQQEITDTVRSAVKTEQFSAKYAQVFDGDERWHALEIPAGDRFAWTDESTYIRRGYDRPHITGWLDSGRVAGRSVADRTRRSAAGVQLLRLSTWQPRGHDARNVRQHPAPQPARPRNGGGLDASPAERRTDDDLPGRRPVRL